MSIAKGSSIVIERTANGMLVRNEWPRDGVVTWADVHVFRHLDYDQLGVQSEETLFSFLLSHFK